MEHSVLNLSSSANHMSVVSYFENMAYGAADEFGGVAKISFFNSVSDLDIGEPFYCLLKNKNTERYKKLIKHFFVNEDCRYNHTTYKLASKIYGAIQEDNLLLDNSRSNTATANTGTKNKLTGRGDADDKSKGAAKNKVPPFNKTNSTVGRSTTNNEQPKNGSSKNISGVNTDANIPTAASKIDEVSGESDAVVAEDDVRDMSSLFRNEEEKRLSFQLVFQTLKYEKFLETMLDKSHFYEVYPEHAEQHNLIIVVLCDYMERKFQPRLIRNDHEDDDDDDDGVENVKEIDCIGRKVDGRRTTILATVDSVLVEIEADIMKHRTKLNAALARCRISLNVLTLDSFLPESVRKNDKIASGMLVSAWVNAAKTSLQEVKQALHDKNFKEVSTQDELTHLTYLHDEHCPDLIFFPGQMLQKLEKTSIVTKKLLILQDKSSSIGLHALVSVLGEDDDVVYVNVGSAISAGHLASILYNRGSTVYAFGVTSKKQLKQCNRNLEKLGVRDRVKLMCESFLEYEHNVEPLKEIKVMIVEASCTRSGVVSPVNFIVSEGKDYDFQTYSTVLQDLASGFTDQDKVKELKMENYKLLKHAMLFPRLQTLIYFTNSLNEAENEEVVEGAIENFNTTQLTKSPYRIAPPGIPLTEKDIESEMPLSSKYLKFQPSKMTSGCFVAVINREADDPQEAARGILAKAAAKGIIANEPQKK